MQDTEQWFTALYEQNASKMLRYASYQLRNASIAEELVEEAFVRLLQRREELLEHPNPAGWLWKTLQHLILTEVKLARYRREVPLEPALNAAAPEMEVSPWPTRCPKGSATRSGRSWSSFMRRSSPIRRCPAVSASRR